MTVSIGEYKEQGVTAPYIRFITGGIPEPSLVCLTQRASLMDEIPWMKPALSTQKRGTDEEANPAANAPMQMHPLEEASIPFERNRPRKPGNVIKVPYRKKRRPQRRIVKGAI